MDLSIPFTLALIEVYLAFQESFLYFFEQMLCRFHENGSGCGSSHGN
jgi:hypothetical protein